MLEKEPGDAFLNYALATEYIAMSEFEAGKEIFEKLVKNQPEYVPTYYHLAKLYERLDRAEDAEAMYEKGIAMAQQMGDQHAKSELHEALNNLLFDMD